jgi:hypothetical protein
MTDNEQFNRYLEMAIAQGWDDPVGFALRRMKECGVRHVG